MDSGPDLAARILDALPQTQCQRCGFADCAAYAQAIASGQAAINRCAPGGAEGITRLARITGQPVQPLDPAYGPEGPRAVAWIDEDWCIGCTLCIKACPVDCIVGSNKFMHTVIESECTGCELCVAACPVDCIQMEAVSGEQTGWAAWSQPQADEARQRYAQRSARLEQRAAARRRPRAPTRARVPTTAARAKPAQSATGKASATDKQAAIAAAFARARKRRAERG